MWITDPAAKLSNCFAVRTLRVSVEKWCLCLQDLRVGFENRLPLVVTRVLRRQPAPWEFIHR